MAGEHGRPHAEVEADGGQGEIRLSIASGNPYMNRDRA
jgi:hypothetical protein